MDHRTIPQYRLSGVHKYEYAHNSILQHRPIPSRNYKTKKLSFTQNRKLDVSSYTAHNTRQ